MPHWYLAFICWIPFVGHKMKPLRRNVEKNFALAQFHLWAGYDCDCLRCGYEWRDAGIPPEALQEGSPTPPPA